MLKRVGVIAVQLLMVLVMLEIGLQLLALVVQRDARSNQGSGWKSQDLRILCLGDSVTYGVVVPRDRTWPAQLQAVWNERGLEPRIETLNLGFPGTNSSRLVRDLPRLLRTFRPDLLIVMIGVNDFWTLPVPTEGEPPRESFWKRHSRLYRFLLLAWRGFEKEEGLPEVEIVLDPEADVETGGRHQARIGGEVFEMGFVKASEGRQGDLAGLERNLETLARQAREAETPLVFMSYPARHDFYRFTNPAIWRIAERTGTPLINHTQVFEPLCPEKACPSHMIWDHHHPNPVGYRVVAETIASRLPALLPELGLAPGSAP